MPLPVQWVQHFEHGAMYFLNTSTKKKSPLHPMNDQLVELVKMYRTYQSFKGPGPFEFIIDGKSKVELKSGYYQRRITEAYSKAANATVLWTGPVKGLFQS